MTLHENKRQVGACCNKSWVWNYARIAKSTPCESLIQSIFIHKGFFYALHINKKASKIEIVSLIAAFPKL